MVLWQRDIAHQIDDGIVYTRLFSLVVTQTDLHPKEFPCFQSCLVLRLSQRSHDIYSVRLASEFLHSGVLAMRQKETSK